MAATASKRRIASAASAQSPAATELDRTAFAESDVEGTLNLGEGYVVIKFRQVPHELHDPARSLAARYPDLERGKIRHLFEKTAPAANAAFTASLDQQSMLSRQRYRDEGFLLGSSDICARLAISRQALSKAVKDLRMFYVDGPSGAQLYPAFFATGTVLRRALEQVSQALGAMPGPSKWEFFITPKISLDERTPVSAIEAGDLPRVLAAAAAFKGR